MDEHPTSRATQAARDDTAGTVIAGRYLIRRVIARGGMATVYLAEDTLLHRPVAVKVLGGDADAGERDTFLQEARAVAKLSHPNIVDVYDAGVEGSLRYIVMQYAPGDTLREVLAREAPLDPQRAVRLAIQLADALHFGHTRGVVHCDMKPGNVLLGDQGEPKIVDFGIARSLTQTAELQDTIAGTVGYISPEQVEGRPIDGRADVYGLAAVLYEMLTGTPPFSGENLAAVAAQRLTKAPLSARERNPFVPEELDQIVMRGLARDPAQRYPTAKAFADALRGYLSGQTSAQTRRIARPVAGATERIPVGRRPAPVTAAPVAPPLEARRPRRSLVFPLLAGVLALLAAALLVALAIGLMDGGGSSTVTVPQATGERLDNAARRIQDAGLTVGNVELVSDRAPFGTVIAQDPPAAETRRGGDPVNLRVSVGTTPP